MSKRSNAPASAVAVRAMKSRADAAAALLKSMANEQRLLILCNLLDGPLSVSELNDRLSLSQSALSQHLAVLREAEVVTTTREAQSIRYELSEGPVPKIIAILYAEFCSN